MSEDILIPAAQITGWQEDKERLKLEIAERQQALTLVERNLEAAATLAAARGQRQLPLPSPAPKVRNNSPRESAPKNITEALERVANTSPAPLTKPEIRERLTAQGFENKGPYFYTIVMRLKERGRITVMSDGKVWRAPPQQ